MPITLGCPSCAKRFRARDESAGKKVKCPYCQSAVPVPTPEESAAAGEPTAPLPAVAPPAPVVASPDDWGALPAGAVPSLIPPPLAPVPAPAPAPARDDERPEPPRERERPRAGEPTPEEVLARRWNKVRRGLFWVQFALLWLALLGAIELGKALYERQVGPLPKGDGADWVSVEGFVNAPDPNAIPLRKEQIIDLAAYGIPATLGAILLVFGRFVAGGGPHISGSRGLYLLSSLFTFVGFVGLVASVLFIRAFTKEARYAQEAWPFFAALAELWFVVALTASGLALKRPGTARRVGVLVYVLAVMLYAVSFGWAHLMREVQPFAGRDERLYTQAAFAIGWLILVAAYWFAVRGVRVGARQYINAAAEGK